jgi:predicted nucleotide-binding protein
MDANNKLTIDEINNTLTQNDPNEQYYTLMDQLMAQFEVAMLAVSMQDPYSSEQALIKAKIINGYNVNFNQDEMIFLKIVLGFIELTTLFLKSNVYSSDERFNKAVEELEAAMKVCEEFKSNYNLLSSEFKKDYDEDGLISLFKFMFFFFERIILVTYKIAQKSLELKSGKYVNEVEIFYNAAAELRGLNYQNLTITNPEVNNLISGIVGLFNRIADTYEKRAERIEEKRKTVEFVKPIDKRVFIVHGHNDGVLREFKEILEDKFKVDPIILRDELDEGNTIIEKFEHYGRLCAFAFVIVTPDDWVIKNKIKYFQARPNVLFELGWFCGRYGRSKVRILRQRETPLPSDLGGLVTHDFNDRIEELYLKIKVDLETSGIL